MTNEEVRSHNAVLVAEIKAMISREQRLRNAAPLMLETLKAMADSVFEQPVGAWRHVINEAIRMAEGGLP